jgi:two-component system sensor histidine kinase YesM
MKSKIQKSILAKLFLGTIITMLIPFIVVNIFTYRMTYRESLQNTVSVNEGFLGIGLDLFEEYLDRLKGIPMVIYENPRILNLLQMEEDYDSEELFFLRQEIGGMIQADPSIRMATLESRNGTVITQEEIGSDNEKRWRAARYDIGDGVFQSGYDEEGNPTVLRYTVQLRDVPFPEELVTLTFYSVPDTLSSIASKVGADNEEGIVVIMSILGENSPLYQTTLIEGKEYTAFGNGYVIGSLNGGSGFFFIGHSSLRDMGLEIIKFVPESVITGPIFQLLLRTLALQGIILFFLLLFIYYIYRIMIAPIKNITSNIDKVQEGEYAYKATSQTKDEVGILDHKYEEMVQTINNLVNETLKSALEISKTRLKMLQAQINPHFLNNTLQSISTQALRSDDKEVSDSITMLARMFQYNVDTTTDFVPLSEEIRHIERYLNLQQARFREKLHYEITCQPEVKSRTVPKMILQPLVENSLAHGLTLGDGRGVVKVEIYGEDRLLDEELKNVKMIDDGEELNGREELNDKVMTMGDDALEQIVIKVVDNGRGFTKEKIDSLRREFENYEITPESGHGIGFLNVLQRLNIYATGFTWDVESVPWKETTVTLSFSTNVEVNGEKS